MLKNIYQELVKTRKGLQAIKKNLEPKSYSFSCIKSDADDLVKKDIQVVECVSYNPDEKVDELIVILTEHIMNIVNEERGDVIAEQTRALAELVTARASTKY